MANPRRRHPSNAPGPWFVDDTCIDCDASRQCAPELFGEVDGQSVVIRQPSSSEEAVAAARAMLACPTGSIGSGALPGEVALDDLFPQELEAGVHYCGYNAASSYGANAFFAVRPEGNLMIDSPRFVRRLVRALEERGGVAHILLTHRDDVADAERFARHFGAEVWIHQADAAAAPFARRRFAVPTEIRPGLVALPVPGHTRGSAVYHLEDRFLFTGDSLHYSRTRGELGAFPSVCWYSWEEQTRSLAGLRELRFEWVLAGHGDRHRASPEWMRASLERLIAAMESGDPAIDAW
jgi:glyoxylase-like metal-dependent hydrolase (beta-lactamase superfamily II)/ferredoxin